MEDSAHGELLNLSSMAVLIAQTAVSMNFRDVLHDPKIWPEPLKFVPERWIVDGKRNTELDKHWVVFSRGHRMCAGLESV